MKKIFKIVYSGTFTNHIIADNKDDAIAKWLKYKEIFSIPDYEAGYNKDDIVNIESVKE